MKIKRGSTSVRRLIFIGDSSSTTGAGLANLAYNTASLVAYYFAGDLSNEVQITLATATLGTFTSGGFVAVDNTNMPGWYEIGIPDAALDGGNEVAIQLRGATNMVPVNIYIELDAFDYQTATQPVNVTQISGDSVAADNAEAFFDGTGYAGTNNVMPTVTTLTNLPAITAGWLTATGIAADAITAAKIADGAIDTATFAAGTTIPRCTLVDTTTTNTDMRGTDGAMLAYTQPTGFLAATFPSDPADQSLVIDATNTILGRLPAALVGGRIDASVGAMAANTLTASALATDAVTEIQSGLSTLGAADIRTAVGLASANLDTQIADLPTVAEFEARTIVAANYATASALTTVDTWVKRSAVILSGTIATAGTSSEVFTISALGITATIAVDASGNRSSVTWS